MARFAGARKLLVVSAVGLGALIVLSGCTPVDHVSAELKDGTVRFEYCAPFRANFIEVTTTPYAHWSSGFTKVWLASGNPALRAGEPVSYGRTPAGFATAQGPLPLNVTKSRIDVVFKDLPTKKSGPWVDGMFDGRKLVEGKWLNWDGQLVDTAC